MSKLERSLHTNRGFDIELYSDKSDCSPKALEMRFNNQKCYAAIGTSTDEGASTLNCVAPVNGYTFVDDCFSKERVAGGLDPIILDTEITSDIPDFCVIFYVPKNCKTVQLSFNEQRTNFTITNVGDGKTVMTEYLNTTKCYMRVTGDKHYTLQFSGTDVDKYFLQFNLFSINYFANEIDGSIDCRSGYDDTKYTVIETTYPMMGGEPTQRIYQYTDLRTLNYFSPRVFLKFSIPNSYSRYGLIESNGGVLTVLFKVPARINVIECNVSADNWDYNKPNTGGYGMNPITLCYNQTGSTTKTWASVVNGGGLSNSVRAYIAVTPEKTYELHMQCSPVRGDSFGVGGDVRLSWSPYINKMTPTVQDL